MGNAPRNAAGTLLGLNGFVLCHTCMRECDMLSRETAPEYAYCPVCRTPTKSKEVPMPSVPKPSAAKAATTPRIRAPRVRKSRAKAAKPAPAMTNSHGAEIKAIAMQLGIGPGRVRSLVKSGRMKLTAESVQEYATSRRVMKKKAPAAA